MHPAMTTLLSASRLSVLAAHDASQVPHSYLLSERAVIAALYARDAELAADLEFQALVAEVEADGYSASTWR